MLSEDCKDEIYFSLDTFLPDELIWETVFTSIDIDPLTGKEVDVDTMQGSEL
jgi:hypothetical protein